jgi:hypothetical protein
VAGQRARTAALRAPSSTAESSAGGSAASDGQEPLDAVLRAVGTAMGERSWVLSGRWLNRAHREGGLPLSTSGDCGGGGTVWLGHFRPLSLG